MTLDNFDRKILALLQTEGRIANQDLAERIGLSPSPCLRRVRALEDTKVIVDYRAILNQKMLGYAITALVNVSMEHSAKCLPMFETEIALIPEVLECLQITGQGADYQLKIVVQNIESYHDLLLNKIARLSGVRGVVSSIVLRRVVDRTALPVDTQLGEIG